MVNRKRKDKETDQNGQQREKTYRNWSKWSVKRDQIKKLVKMVNRKRKNKETYQNGHKIEIK